MFPIVALGAALIGAIAVKEAVDSGPSAKRPAESRDVQDAVAPQSFVVTPVDGGEGAGRRISALEAVRNFVV